VPTYQYTCTACGHELEAVQSFSDAALTECPQCQGSLRKVFSAVGVVFKGSGFYKTDSRSSSGKSSSGGTSEGGTSSSGDSSSSGGGTGTSTTSATTTTSSSATSAPSTT
jgi:putative FmdB family regulatory protein